jgi:hypothetical protein
MRLRLSVLHIVVSVVASGPALAEEDAWNRDFPIHGLDAMAAETMVWDLCKGFPETAECRVSAASSGSIVVRGTPAVHEAVARMLKGAAVTRQPTQTFHFSLVAGKAGAPGFDGDISETGRAALRDIRQLLPFKAFRLVDSGLVRTKRTGQVRLSGDGHSYLVSLDYDNWSSSGERAQIGVKRLVLMQQRVVEAIGAEGIAEARTEYDAILETSLTLDLGETVVVGTSKLNGGDEALILLVTAVR